MSALAWGGAGVTLAGQTRSGDRGVVVSYAGGALAAVIDGLGHGNDACVAALEAERVIAAAPRTPLDQLMRDCHESLPKTRGAVISEHDDLDRRRRGHPRPRGDADVAHARIRSIVVHASHGEIVLSRAHARGRQGLVVIARDRGPGIANIPLAMQDGFTTAGGMGCGLPGAQRLVDKLEIATELGVGTVVRVEKWLP